MKAPLLSCQKNKFSLSEDVRYLNCAYMSPLARSVEEAGLNGLHRKRNPHEITPSMFFDEAAEVRRLFATLVGVSPKQVALIPAASYGIATVARNLPVLGSQNIVVLHEQFPSNIYSWRRLSRDTQAELRVVPPPSGPGRGHEWNTRVLEAIDADTAIVAISAVHWTDGTRFDVQSIGERARACGAALVVDGTQSVGALPFDAATLGVDALICAAYKWLLGPYSFGAMYLGPRFTDGVPLEENWIGRLHSERFGELVQYQKAYQPGAIRYDVGERSNFVLVPMMIAALKQVLDWGPDAIQTYCAVLTRDLLREATALGYRVEEESLRSAHLFGLRAPPHVPMARLREELALRAISVSVRGDAIRIAPHVYNDAADVDALQEALHAAAS